MPDGGDVAGDGAGDVVWGVAFDALGAGNRGSRSSRAERTRSLISSCSVLLQASAISNCDRLGAISGWPSRDAVTVTLESSAATRTKMVPGSARSTRAKRCVSSDCIRIASSPCRSQRSTTLSGTPDQSRASVRSADSAAATVLSRSPNNNVRARCQRANARDTTVSSRAEASEPADERKSLTRGSR